MSLLPYHCGLNRDCSHGIRYPEELADKSFDNTGCTLYIMEFTNRRLTSAVLLEAPFDPIRRQMNSVLLTIDLTKAVADEAIERNDCVVVAYREYACSVVFLQQVELILF